MSALKQALKAVLNGNIQVFDYANATDFKSIWEIAKPSGQFVIVWSSTATDSTLNRINTASCLSPIEWSACAARTWGNDCASWPEVTILDVSPFINQSVPLYKFLKDLRPELFPWLHVYEPKTWALTAFLKHKAISQAPGDGAQNAKVGLERLLREIRRNLTEGGTEAEFNRHAIANIISPMVLTLPKGVILPTTQSLHSAALKVLLESSGVLLHGKNPIESGPLDIRELKFVLLDDQAKQGWETWLRACVPHDKKTQVIVKSTTADFMSFLDTCSLTGDEKKKKAKDRRFSLVLPGCVEADASALLLDLRLFAERGDEEKPFFKKLVEKIDEWKFADEGVETLAWDRLPKTDVDSVRSWATDDPVGSAKPSEDVLLTLFPRFLALLDMSLPIIIFSTTLQRPLLEKLRTYGNIFTGLNKNVFSGSDQPLDYLRSIIPRVANQVRIRSSLAQIRPDMSAIFGSHYKHFELYSDEFPIPEKEGFYLATLVIGYKNDDEAKRISEDLATEGLRWWDDGNTIPESLAKGANKEKSYLLKGGFRLQDWDEAVVPILERHLGKERPMFVVVCQADRPVTPPSVHTLNHRSSLDNVLCELIEVTSEMVLFDILPLMSPLLDFTVAFYGATRMRSLELGKLASPLTMADGTMRGQHISLEEMNDIPQVTALHKEYHNAASALAEMGILPDSAKPRDFGLSWKVGPPPKLHLVYRSLYRHSFGPLLTTVLGSRQGHEDHPSIAKAVSRVQGIQLAYGSKAEPDIAQRTQHYLADEVTHFFKVTPTTFDGGHPKNPTVLGASVRAFAVRNGRGLTALRLAKRLFEAEADGQAISLVNEYITLRERKRVNHSGVFSDELERLLLAGMHEHLRNAKGASLISAVNTPTTLLGISFPKFALQSVTGDATERDKERQAKQEFLASRAAYGTIPVSASEAFRDDIQNLERTWGTEYAMTDSKLVLILTGAGSFPTEIKLGGGIYKRCTKLPPVNATAQGIKWCNPSAGPHIRQVIAQQTTEKKPATPQIPSRNAPASSPKVTESKQSRLTEISRATKVWIGPIPMTLKYEPAMKLVRDAFPNWMPAAKWVGSQSDSWIPLTLNTQNSEILPTEINLGGYNLRITETEPYAT